MLLNIFSNKKYNTILRYAIFAIVFTIALIFCIFQWQDLVKVFSAIIEILEPVIWSAVLAFMMNPIMKSVEKFLARFVFKKKARPKVSRVIGICVASIVLIAAIAAIILTIIPEIISNIPGIYDGFTNEFIPAVSKWISKTLADNPSLATIINNELNDIYSSLQSLLTSLVPQLTNLLSSVFDFANSVKNFIFGFILAIYFLFSKNQLQAQAKKLIVAIFKEDVYSKIFAITTNTNNALLNFIYGKIIDSFIIGCICCAGLLILRMPYVMLISIIIGVTNIIPVFGPFIGAIPCSILVLIADPSKTIWFIIFIFVLQQFDGNILGPKILGNKIGLSSFWVLFAILVFGSMFGIVGMIIGVPIFAVIYDLIRAIVNTRLNNKNMPVDHSYYTMPGIDIGKVKDEPVVSEPEAIAIDEKKTK
ncbi:MAG: AI-2E family transporter [Oscillospiraceae bacterium]|nr:AI-2E family transporter [Oscillospiraceae bacterium]